MTQTIGPLERERALSLLEHLGGNLTQTALETGISKTTLIKWREEQKIEARYSPLSNSERAHRARLEFCAQWPHLAPHEVVRAGYRTLPEWLETVQRHNPNRGHGGRT